jgi:hypothetical protein
LLIEPVGRPTTSKQGTCSSGTSSLVSFPSTAAGSVWAEASAPGALTSGAFSAFALESAARIASAILRTRNVLLGLRVVSPVTSANFACSSFSFILPSFAISFFVLIWSPWW